MTLKKILEHANSEPWTVEGVTLDVILTKCAGDDFLRFNMHPIKFIDDKKSEFFALGNFSIDLDGVLYVPRWSYWLDRPYYIATQQIIESAGGDKMTNRERETIIKNAINEYNTAKRAGHTEEIKRAPLIEYNEKSLSFDLR